MSLAFSYSNVFTQTRNYLVMQATLTNNGNCCYYVSVSRTDRKLYLTV